MSDACVPVESFSTESRFYLLPQLTTVAPHSIITTKGRLHTFRKQGSMSFLVLRYQSETVQCVIFKTKKALAQELSKIPRESYLQITGKLVKAPSPINSCSIKELELEPESYKVISSAQSVLPFQLEDACRHIEDTSPNAIHVGLDQKLNHRAFELRTATNYAIFKLQTAITQQFRQFLIENDFIEIHSPKLISGSSEGGAEVFKLKYFEQSAGLAQSPQLYKQMAICGDFRRVFEIGPVFRAEKSVSHRHLCEFTGLDIEMEIDSHYYEVTNMVSELLISIFNDLNQNYSHELKIIKLQYPASEFKYLPSGQNQLLMVNFREGVEMINQHYQSQGVETRQSANDDLNAANERLLGQIIKEKHGVEIFILDKYPSSARPFYTMPEVDVNGAVTGYTHSYDIIMCGEEIISGSQRINQYDQLLKNVEMKGMSPDTLKDYLEAFKYGVPKHGGCGIGLERLTMLFLNLQNVRRASLFPRDPYRLTP